jgi:hypothetical protein
MMVSWHKEEIDSLQKTFSGHVKDIETLIREEEAQYAVDQQWLGKADERRRKSEALYWLIVGLSTVTTVLALATVFAV